MATHLGSLDGNALTPNSRVTHWVFHSPTHTHTSAHTQESQLSELKSRINLWCNNNIRKYLSIWDHVITHARTHERTLYLSLSHSPSVCLSVACARDNSRTAFGSNAAYTRLVSRLHRTCITTENSWLPARKSEFECERGWERVTCMQCMRERAAVAKPRLEPCWQHVARLWNREKHLNILRNLTELIMTVNVYGIYKRHGIHVW